MVAGVARGLGLADHLRVNVLVVRIAFIVLTFAAGAGLVMYAAFWVFVPVAPAPAGQPPTRASRLDGRGQYVAIGALTIGGVLAVQSLGLGLPAELMWPLALTGFGAAVLWWQADESQRTRWRKAAVGSARPPAVASAIGGACLVIAGAATFLAYHGQLNEIRNGLLAAVVMVAGIAVITGPWWLGTMRELSTERRAPSSASRSAPNSQPTYTTRCCTHSR